MNRSATVRPTTLGTAVAAWNNKTREAGAPMIHHAGGAIRSLRRLREMLDQLSELDEAAIDTPDATDALRHLRDVCARMDRLEARLEHFAREAEALCHEGEAILEGIDAMGRTPADAGAPAARRHQLHLVPGGDGKSERRRAGDARALDRLIEAQKREIEALHQQLVEAEAALERAPAAIQAELPRMVSPVELQNVQEFVQNSKIASIPINASYYERILEVAASPEGSRVPMGRILTEAGVVTEAQLEHALDRQRANRRKALGALLVDLGYTTEKAIAQALAAQLALPYVVLENEGIDPRAVAALPVRLARQHACFPIGFRGHALYVAMANPLDLIALEDLRIASSTPIRPCVAARGDIKYFIDHHYAKT